jgi:hypothetical protein
MTNNAIYASQHPFLPCVTAVIDVTTEAAEASLSRTFVESPQAEGPSLSEGVPAHHLGGRGSHDTRRSWGSVMINKIEGLLTNILPQVVSVGCCRGLR